MSRLQESCSDKSLIDGTFCMPEGCARLPSCCCCPEEHSGSGLISSLKFTVRLTLRLPEVVVELTSELPEVRLSLLLSGAADGGCAAMLLLGGLTVQLSAAGCVGSMV